MAFKNNPFRTSKAFIEAVDEYLDHCDEEKILATAQGFCNYNKFRYDLYESELKDKFPDAYAYARESFFAAAVNAPRWANPATVKSIIDWYLKVYTEIAARNADENKITVEMDDETAKDAK